MNRLKSRARLSSIQVLAFCGACAVGSVAVASVVIECWIMYTVRCSDLHRHWIDENRKCINGQGNVEVCGDRVVRHGAVSDVRIARVGETGRTQIVSPWSTSQVEVVTFKCVSGVCVEIPQNVIRSCQGRGTGGEECAGTLVIP